MHNNAVQYSKTSGTPPSGNGLCPSLTSCPENSGPPAPAARLTFLSPIRPITSVV